MTNLKIILLLLIFSACHYSVDVKKRYQLYFNEATYETFQKGLNAYQNGNHILADSLLSLVINKSKNKLSISMPMKFNPYYYRGHNSVELDKYDQAIKDFEHVASDTTTNTEILLTRTEAFKMLGQYDTAIILCNRLLDLNYDSSIVLSQRGICYYQKGQLNLACADLTISKKLAHGDVAFFDKFLKDCR